MGNNAQRSDNGQRGAENAQRSVDNAPHNADGNTERAVDRADNNKSDNYKSDNNPDRNRVAANADRNKVNAEVDRNRRNDRANLGDRDFDRHGIGALDDSRFRDRNDNRWRFSKWRNQWWYWMPAGYWMTWNGDRWNRYDEGSYVDNYNNNDQQQASNFSGPYYEDQNGFYYLDGNRRVYDQQIRRVGNSLGSTQSLEGASQR
jgi:hypothetical protein